MSATPDRLLVRELWTTSIETQLRLATLSSRSRQLALAFVAIAFASALALLVRGAASIDMTLAGGHLAVHPGVLVLALAAVVLVGFGFIDQQHENMLRGATAFTEDLEEKIVKPAVGGELKSGLAQAFVRERRDERPQQLFRTAIVGLPATLALLVLVVSNVGASRRNTADVAAVPPVTEQTPDVAASTLLPPAVPSEPVALPAVSAGPAFGKPVARTTAAPAGTRVGGATAPATATTAATAAKAGEPAPAASSSGEARPSEAAPVVTAASKPAEAAPSKPAEAAPSKPAEAAPSKPAEAAPSKPAEPPAAKPPESAPTP